ncbi:transposase [Burkholderia pseudomallei]|nr:transposase [Burkholderia pseudomallei]CAJ3988162.1 transposase [Burkholderia pseudomallei]CAJ4516688.1 transposase [Burkholderia pseudomallei]CAJ5115668.1 transposase [Burkholderia pseudomallei]CAJ5875023.1 transposase [Burkholderia pseudomallei]
MRNAAERAEHTASQKRLRARQRKKPRVCGAQIADKPSPSGGFLFFNGVMLKTPMPTQHELEMVTLEELVPKDHLLRQIDAAVDFEFIRAKVAHLYCADNGRPALDPVVMFKSATCSGCAASGN